MKKKYFVSFLCCLIAVLTSCSPQKSNVFQETLTQDWQVFSSQKNKTTGAVISTPDYTCVSSYRATVPSTVMGVLMANGCFPDLLQQKNYTKVAASLFQSTWWYRKSFKLPALKWTQHAQLQLDGLSYAANVWLNGHLVASSDTILGAFRQFTLPITPYVQENNVLAIELKKALPGDLNIGFVDWNPRPHDESMGIFREVKVQLTDAVDMQYTAVKSKVNLTTLNEAWLTVETQLKNHSDVTIKGKLVGEIEGKTFLYPIELAPYEKKKVKLTNEECAALYMKSPKLWWCHTLGEPHLYNMHLSFVQNETISDEQTVTFGVRDVRTYLNEAGDRGFMLNGKKILVTGAGWTDDIFLRDTHDRNLTQVKYVKDMGLNCIRFENVWGTSQEIYDLCDQYGLLALVGWSCHWEWENYLGTPCDQYGGIKGDKMMTLAADYLRDQVLWLRNHPSIIAWFAGSDMIPRPALEKKYLAVLKEIDDRPYVAAAKKIESTLSGNTGTKMAGPYEYVGPNYWYIDKQYGGAYGFNTETCIGAQLPVKESIARFIAPDQMWPVTNAQWNAHCTTSSDAMNTLEVLTKTINERFGEAENLDDYLHRADWINYEGTRAMFEAFRVNQPHTTGLIQWMLNSAWPSFYWQLYDYYNVPTAAYYGVKKANAPQQLIYNYGNHKVYYCSRNVASSSLKAVVSLYDMQSKLLSKKVYKLESEKNNTGKAIATLPSLKENAFLMLQLMDNQENVITDNVYVLSTSKDVYAWDKTTWVHTPMKSYAQFKSMSTLTKVNCEVKHLSVFKDRIEFEVHNPTPKIAFQVRFALKNKAKEIISPVFWKDNYITLLPFQVRKMTCSIPDGKLLSTLHTLELTGWNLISQKNKIGD